MGGKDKLERFEQAVLPHLDAAYNLARWLTRNEHDAQDMVQEASLRAFKFFDGFHGVDARAWLLTTVRNTCYTWLAQNRRSQVTTSFDEEIHSVEEDALNPSALALKSGDVEMLKESLEELPDEFREVIVLRDLEELSYKQIAEVINAPLGTVMSRLARARGRLKRIEAQMELCKLLAEGQVNVRVVQGIDEGAVIELERGGGGEGEEGAGGDDAVAAHDDRAVVQRAARGEDGDEQLAADHRVDRPRRLRVHAQALRPLHGDERADVVRRQELAGADDRVRRHVGRRGGEERHQRVGGHARQRAADLGLEQHDDREREVEEDLARDRLERRQVEGAGHEE